MKRWTCDAVYSHGIPGEAYAIAETAEDAVALWTEQGYTDIENVEERTPRLGYTVVFGNFKWGSGTDLAAAKREFRRQGGRLGDGYAIARFDDETDFIGFGGMGYYYFGNAPEVTGGEAAMMTPSERESDRLYIEFWDHVAENTPEALPALSRLLAAVWDEAFDNFAEQAADGMNPSNNNPYEEDAR